MILIVFYLILGILFAFICKSMARKRGRDTAIWAILGFFFGIITVIVLAIAGPAEKAGTAATDSPLDQLAKLNGLVNDGVLTQEEFAEQKAKLLGSS